MCTVQTNIFKFRARQTIMTSKTTIRTSKVLSEKTKRNDSVQANREYKSRQPPCWFYANLLNNAHLPNNTLSAIAFHT